ncbi:MAG: Rne/Rng family ribonuclease [Clostridia bacterium]|nr:Rne/Rng family ribonuclease [Clostridia bacterium]MBQ9714758.1 Rne/Rng family ribonuclease [Clostridia bacterium]
MQEKIKTEWFLDRYCGQQFAALVEDGKLTEFYCEKEPRTSCVGNIYKGQVANVLSGMNAAFIHCGLEKNCYLSMEETYTDYTKYDGTLGAEKSNLSDLKVGDEIIVQVTKPPRGNKGAKVTTHLSFVGKSLIYLPNTDFLGISRKITDEATREKLLLSAEKMRASSEEGFIIRTKAPFISEKQLKAEAKYLKKLHTEMLETANSSPVGSILYEDEDLPVRVMRDSYGEDFSAIHVGDKELYERLLRLIKLRKDIPESKLIFYQGERSMMREYGIMPLIYGTASPIVPLENGGYLVIEHTEAMTVVDVNTGSYVGENNLEETVFSVNLTAAAEIAKQVRLRNIGGIVVVDFIDMVEETHREAVTEALKTALAQDRAKCNVLPMSELCLTQFTRKRLGSDMHSYLVKACEHCEGRGHVHDDIFVITRLRADILDCFAEGNVAAVVELNENIMQRILSHGLFSKEAVGRWKDKQVCFIPHKTFKENFFTVHGEKQFLSEFPERAKIL